MEFTALPRAGAFSHVFIRTPQHKGHPHPVLSRSTSGHTARWTPAKGLTAYTYDKVGNLTFVNYPVGTSDVTLGYDALSRLTSMVDGVGSTAFTYTSAGDLLTEDGPWSSDTVTFSYHQYVPHLRTNLTLSQPSGSWSQT